MTTYAWRYVGKGRRHLIDLRTGRAECGIQRPLREWTDRVMPETCKRCEVSWPATR